MNEYAELKRRLASGWNTWNTRSVLSHVLLPEGFALNLGIKEFADGAYLKEALIGRHGDDEEKIHPAPRSYDGSYTELNLKWRNIELLVQSATDGDDLLLLVTPLVNQRQPCLLVVEPGMLWNRPGYVLKDGDALVGRLPAQEIRAYGTASSVEEPYIAAQTPYLAMTLEGPVGMSTGRPRALAEIQAVIARRKAEREAYVAGFGELAEVYAPVQTCLAWDTVYDPKFDRVVSPVSRLWNVGSGGYILFEWDNYFAGFMAAIDNKELAYANVIEMTREITEDGLVPNFARPTGLKSRDRSEPPVGCLVVRELYRRFGDRWLLEEIFDDLLRWNHWWSERRDCDGLLAWGSDPFEPLVDNYWEHVGVNERFGGSLESGLDNSPMYDDVPFNTETHRLELADVGLTSLYITDCRALAELADALDRTGDAAELRQRAQHYFQNLQTLWNEETGIFLNKRTDTGEFSHRLSPTLFYPLIGTAATPAQVQRMLTEHFYNPAEFWGEWIMPSIARNDPGYPDNSYWRGRIWAPMNFLVYLGLREYETADAARRDLVAKSRALLLAEWREKGHVHENYNADTGVGCDVGNSDRFYHWGGLLGLISFIDAGYFDKQADGQLL